MTCLDGGQPGSERCQENEEKYRQEGKSKEKTGLKETIAKIKENENWPCFVEILYLSDIIIHERPSETVFKKIALYLFILGRLCSQLWKP